MGIRSGLSPELYMELANAVVSRPDLFVRSFPHPEKLGKGIDLQKPSKNVSFFQTMELRMISLGIQAGAADEVMEKFSQRYKEKSLGTVSHIVSIHPEPTIVIALSFWWDSFCSLL